MSYCMCGCDEFYRLVTLNCGHGCCYNCLITHPNGGKRAELERCPHCETQITSKRTQRAPITQLDQDSWDNQILLALANKLKAPREYDDISRLLYDEEDASSVLNEFLIKAKTLSLNADTINKPNIKGFTPLHLAIIYCDNYSLEWPYIELTLLLKHGADPNLVSYKHMPPLYLAMKYGNERVFSLLLKYGANPDVIYKGKSLEEHSKRKLSKYARTKKPETRFPNYQTLISS